MKKITTIIWILCILFSSNLYAQNKSKHEIQAGIGFKAREAVIIDGFIDFFSILFLQKTQPVNRSNGGYLTYKYQFSKVFALGITSAVTRMNGNNEYQTKANGGNSTEAAIMGIETSFTYLNKNNLQLYALTGGGIFYSRIWDKSPVTSDDELYGPTFQVTPIGIRYGKSVAAFAELGYGYKGIANLGVSLKF